MFIREKSECGLSTISILTIKFLELSAQAPRRVQLSKAAALCIYTQGRKSSFFNFLYTGGNNNCRTEEKTAERNKIRDSDGKRRSKPNRRQQKRGETRTGQSEEERWRTQKSCATPNKIIRNLPWTAKKKGIGEKAKISRNQQKQTIQTDQSDDCLINKPITKSKLQQPCRNSECRVLSWSVQSSIRSLTAGRQKSRYVSYGTFGTSICLWSSNRQINVCVFP